MNFDDKIFFFEPINKFYDLPWLKQLAYIICTDLIRGFTEADQN